MFAGDVRVSLVALPLGNAQDLSPRAQARLREAELIYCEDTRKLKELLTRSGVQSTARFVALPGDRERAYAWERDLKGLQKVVLVSDAGTPVVNDPGLALVEWCRSEGIAVEAVPGPSAPVMAWQWSGGFGLPFLFMGFVPKARAGSKALSEFFAPLGQARTFCFFDTRHQVAETLAHLMQLRPDRRCFVAREMSKAHEELLAGTVASCQAALAERLKSGEGVGELTLLLEGEVSSTTASVSLTDLVRLRSGPPREAAKLAARLTGHSAKECYSALVAAEAADAE